MRGRIVSRASASFDRAIFYKPRTGSWPGLEETYAPLIVQEIGEHELNEGDAIRFVYVSRDHATVGDSSHDRVSYFWRSAGSDTPSGLPWQGFRITIGQDGFPLVWEVLNSAERVALVYVSETAERAAQEAYGPPQPGRRFAIERCPGDVNRPMVVNVLPDGPVPMGPYIYLAKGSHEVTTVLCRCSPSQMKEVVEARWYDLRPGDVTEVSSGVKFREPQPLSEQLRWPPGL